MSTDILFVSHNRLEFTRLSLAALLKNTDWSSVGTLFFCDDNSLDGTAEFIQEFGHFDRVDCLPGTLFHTDRVRGPVAAMNWYLDMSRELDSDRFVKIDNDIIVCPGWLEETARQATLHPEIDVFGILPNTLGLAEAAPMEDRTVLISSHIGGVGLIRKRIFDHCRPRPNGRFGWTEFQRFHKHIVTAWIDPAMPCFELDKLPFEPYMSLAAKYVEKGWQRAWGPYDQSSTSFWEWWTEEMACV